jgi:sugar phosphate isomerase/epimerase
VSDLPVIPQSQNLAPTLEPLLSGQDGTAIREALDRLHALRFRTVQLSATQAGLRPRDLDGSARRDLLATLRHRELAVAGLDLWIPPRHFLESSNADRAVHAVHQTIELAADLGRVPVSINMPAIDPTFGETSKVGEIAGALSAHADKFGVAIANHTAPAPSIPGCSIGVGIDPAAWLAQGKDPAAAVLGHASQLVSVRLCDLLHTGLRAPIGERRDGQLDLMQYRVAVIVAQYARPIVIDARQWIDPWVGVQQTRKAWTGHST